MFVSTPSGVRLWVFVSSCSPLVVRLRRRTARRPARGQNTASGLAFRGRGVHRFALDPPSSTCQTNGQDRPGNNGQEAGAGRRAHAHESKKQEEQEQEEGTTTTERTKSKRTEKIKQAGDGNGGQAVVVEQADSQRRRRAAGRDQLRRTASRTPTTSLAFTDLPLAAGTARGPARALAARGSSPAAAGATVPGAMTAKQQLRQLVDELSEVEAAEALDILAARHDKRDSLSVLLDNAPLDDEPTTPEEEALVQEARDEVERGELISADEIRREFG